MRCLRWLTPAAILAALACAPGPAQAQDAQPRIIAGSDVPISTYPFQVSLREVGAPVGDGFICGGSIRDETHIITAAHCVTAGALKAPLPASAFTVGYGSDARASQSLVGVSGVSVPAEYQFPTLDDSYDVAVLTLSAPIDLSGPNAKAIPLVNPAQPEDAGTGIVTGWGDTSEGGETSQTLKGTRVPLQPDSACASHYAGFVPPYVPARGVCAGGGPLPDGSNPDTCQGDSGGPLVVDLDNSAGTSFALLGLTSFGDGCGRQNVPAAYTDTQGSGIDSFLNASTFQTATVTGGNFESGTPGARVVAQPAAVPVAAPVAALRDTRRPTARLSRLSCTRRRRCTFRIRVSDDGGVVARLSATVRRRVRTCRGRGDARVCRTRTRRKTLRPRRVSGGFVLRATLARATYKLTAVATDPAGNRSRTLTKTFRVRR